MMTRDTTRAAKRAAPLVLASSLVLVPGLPAQEPPLGTPVPPDPPCVCAWEGQPPAALRSFFRMSRARIGVELGERTEVGGRTGVRIADVEEGGPADRAGLDAGDVLLAVDGRDLGEDPVDALLDRLADADAGDTVTVVFSRDGRQQTARIVTDRARAVSFLRPAPRGGVRGVRPLREGVMAPGARVRMRQVLRGDLQLVAMNEGLGRYFDTSEGVLVAAVEEDTSLGLRPGDVIVRIGGREVEDPAHARSILASYRADETITFDVVREGRRITVTGTRGGAERR